jgi:undecaprenyl pyrophosphate synthase
MSALFDLAKLKALLQKFQSEKKYPKHVVINLFPVIFSEQAQKDELKRYYDLFDSVIGLQVHYGIPIFTVSLGRIENIPPDSLTAYCDTLLKKSIENQINVTIFGKWYDLKGNLVEALKKVNNESNEFDKLFLNVCINYDGQQEIADASKVMLKKAAADKLKTDQITPASIKENLYSSYFIPPELTIEPGKRFSGTFLWDTKDSQIVFLKKQVLDISKQDLAKAIEDFSISN